MNHSIKLITFDVTGTLLKFRREPASVYATIGKKYGVSVDPDRMKVAFKTHWKELNQRIPHYGNSWQDWWTQFVVGTFMKAGCTGVTSPKVLTIVADEILTLFGGEDCWEVMEGSHKLLTGLKNSQTTDGSMSPVILGIISNFDPRLHKILKLKGINSYFDFVLTSFETQCSKPSPEIFQLAIDVASKMNPSIVPAEALHIGDNYELDYCGARAAGWNAILLESSKVTSKKESNSDIITVPSLEALSIYLANNRKLLTAFT